VTTYVHNQERMAPQNRMGIAVDDGTSLPDAMLEAHLLGWNVRKSATLTLAGEGDDIGFIDVPGKYSLIADNPYEGPPFMVVGNDVTIDYVEVQNEQVAEFVSDVLDVAKGDLLPQAIGSYKGGSQCFVNLRRPEGVLIGGSDLVQQDLFVNWGHDGGTSITIMAKSLRMFCTNQIGSMLGDKTAPRFKIRHVGDAHNGRVAEAREALQIMAKGQSEFEKIAEQWAAQAVTNRQFDAIVEGLLPTLSPVDVHPAQATRRMTDQHTLREIYAGDPMNGNAWGALNAWTEMGDWFGHHATEEARALAQLTSLDLERRRRSGARTVSTLMNLPLAVG
jgi:hypothetical protein